MTRFQYSCGENLGGVGRKEIIIIIYCKKKIYFSIKESWKEIKTNNKNILISPIHNTKIIFSIFTLQLGVLEAVECVRNWQDISKRRPLYETLVLQYSNTCSFHKSPYDSWYFLLSIWNNIKSPGKWVSVKDCLNQLICGHVIENPFGLCLLNVKTQPECRSPWSLMLSLRW